MQSRKPLKRDELFRRLKRFGVEVLKKRGKGSELVLLQPDAPGSKKGEIFSIKDHGKTTEYPVQTINALLRRFRIDSEAFWSQK